MKKIVILLIMFFIIAASADELADNKQKLEELNLQIEALEKHLQKNQSLKKEKQSAIEEMQRKKIELENRICELDEDQCKAKEEWDNTKNKLKNTAINLDSKKQTVQELYNSAHELGEALVVSHFSRLLNVNPDAWIISDALKQADNRLNNLNADISSLEEKRISLEKKEKKDANYFKDVQWTKIVSKKKKNKYQKKLINLDKEVVSLDQEYQQALDKKNELEEMQQQMNKLIARLQQKRPAYKPAYSYKFSSAKLSWPLKGDIIRSFGDYKGANNRVSLHNDGIDIAAAIGTEVRCIDKGVVAFAGRNGGSGRVVIVDHQNGFYSIYSHNDHIAVALGDKVQKGSILALSGNSGLTEVPCLHFEIRKDGKAENPLDYLE